MDDFPKHSVADLQPNVGRNHELGTRMTADGLHLTITGDGRTAAVPHLVERLDADGPIGVVPIDHIDSTDGGLVARGADTALEARLTVRPAGALVAIELDVTWIGGQPEDAGLRFGVHLPGTVTEPRWLVPGSFYRENRPAELTTRYPRAVAADGDPDDFESSWWSFRSDRAATPAVFGWTGDACAGLAVDPITPVGMSGLGFAAGPAPRVWVDLPYREEPVVYRADPTPGPAVVTTHRWTPGERQVFRLLLSLGPPNPHAYIPLVRACYERDRARHALAPWMDVADAAELAAHGLYTWHWHPEHDALYETASFDRALKQQDRANMHVAWVSGIPWAQTLLAFGRARGADAYVDAGARVIDHVCAELTPAGTFWGEWRRDDGWGCGWTWNANLDWLHARTLAEATMFTLRAVRAERDHGVDRPGWASAAARHLRFVVARQDDHGNVGSYYHHATGEVMGRDGAAGLLWVAALTEGAAVLGAPDLLDAARRAAAHYAPFVEDAFVNGAPEDVHLAPTSEDAYNAVIAYVSMHRADPHPRWLDLARLAADWTMTFRWTYNVAFDEHTILRQYDFRTRGADNASPPNQHLHAYGLVALGELVELWRWTDDRYFLDRARDNLACFLQMIARADGDFNAGKGMVTERYYHTDCFEPKGSMLTLSHAWCVGVLLHACQVAGADPAAFPPGLAWAHEPGA